MTLLASVTRVSAMLLLGSALHIGAAQASQVYVTVDVSGTLDMDERGAETNIVRELSVGAGATIESLKWDLQLTSYDPSYLSEMQLTFSDSLGNGVTFTPGGGDDFEGSSSYAGFQDLRLLGQHFQLGDDGLLRLEFHDAYKDLAFDEPEGMWRFGTLAFGVSTVPEPQVLSLMLGGLLAMLGVGKWRPSRAQPA
ncbi:PEP-CTERM sorting domain-containing protein [Pseudorhodoferax soli]|uniref:Putative secreted protein with PEP-CTERM sorting signal n=1 Tax=Pseudorhodoferax soli TaxID=545864 RepID=A0A368XJ75_9BURK|nr:PEP-CTERM sorting domain-containing protein [Pseudorhodoferax soli]RCW67982.1 putative secreted protein with PEP-CTERM sorting signal [Pseudorhodoferax soli]